MTIAIRRVVSREEFDKVYRFRYSVYVEEMRRNESHACHDNRRIVDPLDYPQAGVFGLERRRGRRHRPCESRKGWLFG